MTAGQTPQFAVIGEALVDLVDPGDDTACTARAGGSPLNVAVGLARLDQDVAFVGRFSTDPFGTVLRNHATRSGVDTSLAVEGRQPSTIALVRLEDGVARYEFSIDATVDFQWADSELAALPPTVRWVHFGSLASWMAPGDAAIARRVAALHAAGSVILSYDPNVRPPLQPEAASARDQVERALRYAHLVKASAEDVAWLYGAQSPESVAQRWLAAGPGLVVITHGGEGATAFVPDAAPLDRPVYPAAVVDTVGAGDAFTAGLLDALGRRNISAPHLLAGLRNPAMLAAVLDEAALVAALTCTRAGANPPWRSEVEPLRVALRSVDGPDAGR
ncbi:MAG: carbohydrate kinase [Jatrophihabitantaceae bacterium]